MYNALFDRIEELEEKYLGVWAEVCRIESPTEYKEGVDRVGQYFMEKAEAYGWSIQVLKQPVSGDCICITMNPESGERPVVFSSHMDTVHPVGLFGEEPVTWDEEKIYGPGVVDCKGGAVAALYAMEALHSVGFAKRPVMLILQSDEENGSRTSEKQTVQFICKQAEHAIAFLNGEGYAPGQAVVSRKGICKYEFEVTGRSVHASGCCSGASAICEAAYKIVELEKQKNPEGITCSCGLIRGGTAENTVPDKCVFTADFRFANEEEMHTVEELVQQIAEQTTVEGTSCQVRLKSRRCAMVRNEKNRKLLEQINQVFEEAGIPTLEESHRRSGSDAADVTAYGIPCLDGFGVEGLGIHRRQEWAYIRSLKESAKRMATVAYGI